jgi:cytochrome c-type biogenesis protein CcmH
MTLWVLFTVLLLAAVAFVVWPLYRNTGRFSALLATAIVVVVALSAGMYHFIGNPGVPSGAATAQGEMSIADYEKTIEQENRQNPRTLVSLAVTLLEAGNNGAANRANELFEEALRLDPRNPNALFYSGLAAAGRGDTALAAERWETLQRDDTPPEIRGLLQEKIDEWRGNKPPILNSIPIVIVNVSVSTQARAVLPEDASVYVIARDPKQPSPPVAVVRGRLIELPMAVSLGDLDSMVPGRSLSGFSRLELLVRVSIGGGPIAQSGDWFGALIFEVGGDNVVDLIVDQQVP